MGKNANQVQEVYLQISVIETLKATIDKALVNSKSFAKSMKSDNSDTDKKIHQQVYEDLLSVFQKLKDLIGDKIYQKLANLYSYDHLNINLDEFMQNNQQYNKKKLPAFQNLPKQQQEMLPKVDRSIFSQLPFINTNIELREMINEMRLINAERQSISSSNNSADSTSAIDSKIENILEKIESYLASEERSQKFMKKTQELLDKQGGNKIDFLQKREKSDNSNINGNTFIDALLQSNFNPMKMLERPTIVEDFIQKKKREREQIELELNEEQKEDQQEQDPSVAQSLVNNGNHLLSKRLYHSEKLKNIISQLSPIVQQTRKKLGEFHYDTMPDGLGNREWKEAFPFKDGIYEGEWLKERNVIEGKGIVIFKNGSIFEGWYRDNKQTGNGRLIFGEGNWIGEVYEGEYDNGEWNGFGKYSSKKGQEYVGYYKNGKRHGYGARTYSDGGSYTGEFIQDKRHGKGTYKYPNQEIYEGESRENRREGQGIYIQQRDFILQPLFSNNGDKFVGLWVRDKKHGLGIMNYADGTKREGRWENGERVEWFGEAQ